MHKIVITAGIGYNARGGKLATRHIGDALENIREAIAKRVGGYTETDTEGAWKGPEGYIVNEAGKRWEMLLDKTYDGSVYSIGRQLAQHVAAELDQHSVVLEVSEVFAEFITQGGAQ